MLNSFFTPKNYVEFLVLLKTSDFCLNLQVDDIITIVVESNVMYLQRKIEGFSTQINIR